MTEGLAAGYAKVISDIIEDYGKDGELVVSVELDQATRRELGMGAGRFITRFDANGDDSLSAQELADAGIQIAEEKVTQAVGVVDIASTLASSGLSVDGGISVKTIFAAGILREESIGGQLLVDAVDVDGDGTVSEIEMAKGLSTAFAEGLSGVMQEFADDTGVIDPNSDKFEAFSAAVFEELGISGEVLLALAGGSDGVLDPLEVMGYAIPILKEQLDEELATVSPWPKYVEEFRKAIKAIGDDDTKSVDEKQESIAAEKLKLFKNIGAYDDTKPPLDEMDLEQLLNLWLDVKMKEWDINGDNIVSLEEWIDRFRRENYQIGPIEEYDEDGEFIGMRTIEFDGDEWNTFFRESWLYAKSLFGGEDSPLTRDDFIPFEFHDAYPTRQQLLVALQSMWEDNRLRSIGYNGIKGNPDPDQRAKFQLSDCVKNLRSVIESGPRPFDPEAWPADLRSAKEIYINCIGAGHLLYPYFATPEQELNFWNAPSGEGANVWNPLKDMTLDRLRQLWSCIFIAQYDYNGDGVISREDFNYYYEYDGVYEQEEVTIEGEWNKIVPASEVGNFEYLITSEDLIAYVADKYSEEDLRSIICGLGVHERGMILHKAEVARFTKKAYTLTPGLLVPDNLFYSNYDEAEEFIKFYDSEGFITQPRRTTINKEVNSKYADEPEVATPSDFPDVVKYSTTYDGKRYETEVEVSIESPYTIEVIKYDTSNDRLRYRITQKDGWDLKAYNSNEKLGIFIYKVDGTEYDVGQGGSLKLGEAVYGSYIELSGDDYTVPSSEFPRVEGNIDFEFTIPPTTFDRENGRYRLELRVFRSTSTEPPAGALGGLMFAESNIFEVDESFSLPEFTYTGADSFAVYQKYDADGNLINSKWFYQLPMRDDGVIEELEFNLDNKPNVSARDPNTEEEVVPTLTILPVKEGAVIPNFSGNYWDNLSNLITPQTGEGIILRWSATKYGITNTLEIRLERKNMFKLDEVSDYSVFQGADDKWYIANENCTVPITSQTDLTSLELYENVRPDPRATNFYNKPIVVQTEFSTEGGTPLDLDSIELKSSDYYKYFGEIFKVTPEGLIIDFSVIDSTGNIPGGYLSVSSYIKNCTSFTAPILEYTTNTYNNYSGDQREYKIYISSQDGYWYFVNHDTTVSSSGSLKFIENLPLVQAFENSDIFVNALESRIDENSISVTIRNAFTEDTINTYASYDLYLEKFNADAVQNAFDNVGVEYPAFEIVFEVKSGIANSPTTTLIAMVRCLKG